MNIVFHCSTVMGPQRIVFVDAPNTNQIYGEVFKLEDFLLYINCETTVLIDPQLNTTFSEILSQPFGTM